MCPLKDECSEDCPHNFQTMNYYNLYIGIVAYLCGYIHFSCSLQNHCVIIGEDWHDAYPYLQGDQYDSIMNYSFTKACLDYFAREKFDAKAMAEKLNANLMHNLEQVNVMMLNLLDSHDTHRFFSEVGCDKISGVYKD